MIKSGANSKGKKQILILVLPFIFGCIGLLEYYFLKNYDPLYNNTHVYGLFIGAILSYYTLLLIVDRCTKEKNRSEYQAPFLSLVFVLLIAYDLLTLKSQKLMYPYFPCVDQILNSMIKDRAMLLDCLKNSLILLFTGYLSGSAIGLVTGISCGFSKKVNYWISPLMKILGAIPSTTWLPIVMVLATTLFKGSVFVIGLGVWYSVAMASATGIMNVEKYYYEVAETLGASKIKLVFNVAIPFALPNIFQGLTQGMSSACTALIVAEMIGVESGLGWYINWQKSWAEFSKMYAAIILICLTFLSVNFLLNYLKKKVLKWKEGVLS